MFAQFAEHLVPTDRGVIFARFGGNGPPLLLLHGYPQTHIMWHAAADLLVERCTMVAADLPGMAHRFGQHPRRTTHRTPSARWARTWSR